MSPRLELVDDDQHQPEQQLAASIRGIVGCIEVGLAHLAPEQRRLWDRDAQLNLLLAPPPDQDG